MTDPQIDALFRFAVGVLDDDDDGISNANYNLLLDMMDGLPEPEREGRWKDLRMRVNATDDRFYLRNNHGLLQDSA